MLISYKTPKKPKNLLAFAENVLNNKTIPLTLPLFIKYCFISDFKQNAQLFQDFLTKQYLVFDNNSTLATNLNHVADRSCSIFSIVFSASDVGKILQNLNSKKAKRNDDVSIRILKTCNDSSNPNLGGGLIYPPPPLPPIGFPLITQQR